MEGDHPYLDDRLCVFLNNLDIPMLKLVYGECLQAMAQLPVGSVDLVLCDLPYGTTACKWDTVIPFDALWAMYSRVAKPNTAIVLTASQPFTSTLVMSNLREFKYEWIWEKSKATQHALCKLRPMKAHESILVFYKAQPTYNPQMTEGEPYKGRKQINPTAEWNMGSKRNDNDGSRYPRTVHYEVSGDRGIRYHPTQKPLALMKYLIRTYTHVGMTVLDNCMGSGTTGVAAIQTGRNFIGIEQDKKYYKVARERILRARANRRLTS